MSAKTIDVDAIWYRQSFISYLLWPLSLLFAFVAAVRRWFYSIGLLKTTELPVPVIVVGNLTVGGTGKTPMVIALVHWLIAEGYQPGVVARGYGRDQVDQSIVVTDRDTVDQVGDEGLVMARNMNAPLILNKDRSAAALQLVNDHHCNIIVSDDGLQHYRLGRDIEILMIDGQRRFGNGRLLPAGPLREPVQRAQSCDFRVVVQGSPLANEFRMQLDWLQWRNVNDHSRTHPIEHFRAKRVHAFVAIGNPGRFFDELNKNQIDYVQHVYPDHHRYQVTDFVGLSNETILMTEKDAVKCRHMSLHDAWYVELNAELPTIMKQKLLDRIEQSRAQ